jgi:hypothetical protein
VSTAAAAARLVQIRDARSWVFRSVSSLLPRRCVRGDVVCAASAVATKAQSSIPRSPCNLPVILPHPRTLARRLTQPADTVRYQYPVEFSSSWIVDCISVNASIHRSQEGIAVRLCIRVRCEHLMRAVATTHVAVLGSPSSTSPTAGRDGGTLRGAPRSSSRKLRPRPQCPCRLPAAPRRTRAGRATRPFAPKSVRFSFLVEVQFVRAERVRRDLALPSLHHAVVQHVLMAARREEPPVLRLLAKDLDAQPSEAPVLVARSSGR